MDHRVRYSANNNNWQMGKQRISVDMNCAQICQTIIMRIAIHDDVWKLGLEASTPRTKYWVSKFWAGVPGVYNICSKCVSAGCLGAGTAACITANSASMETLCPASALPPPDVRSRNCSKFQKFPQPLFSDHHQYCIKGKEANKLGPIKSVKYQFWQLVQIQISSTEFQISFTVAKCVHIWWWIDQIDHVARRSRKSPFAIGLLGHIQRTCWILYILCTHLAAELIYCVPLLITVKWMLRTYLFYQLFLGQNFMNDCPCFN